MAFDWPEKKPVVMYKTGFDLNLGADDETRTRTACGHYPLKIACLPIPPRRHIVAATNCFATNYFGMSCTGVFGSAGLVSAGVAVPSAGEA